MDKSTEGARVKCRIRLDSGYHRSEVSRGSACQWTTLNVSSLRIIEIGVIADFIFQLRVFSL